jgi:UDP-N-acetylglucosamine--N-acetylmuramyl-(pentapeptide) pyrophosphoryl-undecaprenol N-acetylglucosamine transferase
VAFTSSTAQLKRGQVVGNPLRPSVLEPVDPTTARTRYDLPDGPVLGVFGGSQGARIINEAVARLASTWAGPPLGILHLTGHDLESAADNQDVAHRVVPYETDMQFFYAASDLVVSRAGAISVSELAATATPSILVPYSFGQASHQAENAAVLSNAGAARILHQDALHSLERMVADLMADLDTLSAMSRAASSVAVVNAASKVADVVLEEAARG